MDHIGRDQIYDIGQRLDFFDVLGLRGQNRYMNELLNDYEFAMEYNRVGRPLWTVIHYHNADHPRWGLLSLVRDYDMRVINFPVSNFHILDVINGMEQLQMICVCGSFVLFRVYQVPEIHNDLMMINLSNGAFARLPPLHIRFLFETSFQEVNRTIVRLSPTGIDYTIIHCNFYRALQRVTIYTYTSLSGSWVYQRAVRVLSLRGTSLLMVIPEQYDMVLIAEIQGVRVFQVVTTVGLAPEAHRHLFMATFHNISLITSRGGQGWIIALQVSCNLWRISLFRLNGDSTGCNLISQAPEFFTGQTVGQVLNFHLEEMEGRVSFSMCLNHHMTWGFRIFTYDTRSNEWSIIERENIATARMGSHPFRARMHLIPPPNRLPQHPGPGGRFGIHAAGRGGRGYNREAGNGETSNRNTNAGVVDNVYERRGYSSSRGADRGARRAGYINGDVDGERPRSVFERRSRTDCRNEFQREGAVRGNLVSPTVEVSLVPEEPVVENEKYEEPEKPSVQEDCVNVRKENPPPETEEKEPEEKEMTLEEYEKVLTYEKRKVGLDKDLLLKKKRARKSLSINEFLKRAEGETIYNGGPGSGCGGRGGCGGGKSINDVAARASDDVGPGGRFGIHAVGRGGRGYNREAGNGETSNRNTNAGVVDNVYERRGYSSSRGADRGARRAGYINGDVDGERPRSVFERRSRTDCRNEFQREGAVRGNLVSPTVEVSLVPEEPVVENEKYEEPEKPSVQEDCVNVRKENPPPETEEKEPEEKEMTLEEYEKVLTYEKRKVGLDKDLLLKKKRARKSLSINEFLKRAEGETIYNGGPGSGCGGRGGCGGGKSINDVAARASDDVGQFPLLGFK